MGLFSLIYRKNFVHRYDDDHIIKYFSYKDFPGLEERPVSFRTPQGLTIRGHIYSYPDKVASDKGHPKELVVFCHGLGGGHRSYMREIELICRSGYEVLSYDCIGCWESEGSDIRGISESVNDLISCIDYICSSDELKDRAIHVIGHSWGGFAAGNILNFRKENIKSITVISGFASIDTLTDAGFGGKLKPFKKYIKRFERKANGNLADCCSVDALRATDTKALLIHSRDDQMADISTGLDYVRSRISNPNVKYLEVEGKFHNPNYTEDAVAYMRQTFGEYEALVKSKKLRTLEQKKAYMADKGFLRMTEQDGKIWDKIFSHMEKAL